MKEGGGGCPVGVIDGVEEVSGIDLVVLLVNTLVEGID